jgi:hypothetical protein
MAITPRACGAVTGSLTSNSSRRSLISSSSHVDCDGEVLQWLHRGVLRTGDRFGPGQTGQRLVAITGREQANQILPSPRRCVSRENNSSKQAA